MSVVSHGNNRAGESAYVDAGVLSPLGIPKVVATTAKIPMLVLVLTQRSNFVSPGRRQWRFFHFLQRQRLLKFACIHLHLSVFAIFCQACSWCVWKQNRPWKEAAEAGTG